MGAVSGISDNCSYRLDRHACLCLLACGVDSCYFPERFFLAIDNNRRIPLVEFFRAEVFPFATDYFQIFGIPGRKLAWGIVPDIDLLAYR